MDSFEKPRTDLYRLSCHFGPFWRPSYFWLWSDCETCFQVQDRLFPRPFAVASFVQYFCNVVVRYSAKDKLFRWRNLLCTSHATATWMWTVVKWGDQVNDTNGFLATKTEKHGFKASTCWNIYGIHNIWQLITSNRKKILRPQAPRIRQ